MIKQITGVPDHLIPVRQVRQKDGSYLWEDAALGSSLVMMALVDDSVTPYVIDSSGAGRLDSSIAFRPAVCCPKCGQHMWVKPHKDLSDGLEYQCACGTMRRINVS